MSKTKQLMNMIKLERFIETLPENEKQSLFEKFIVEDETEKKPKKVSSRKGSITTSNHIDYDKASRMKYLKSYILFKHRNN